MGNVALSTQAHVNAWPPCYAKIQGNLTIQGTGITNLGPLTNLTWVTGNVTIQSTGLTNVTGLNNLATVGATLKITLNNSLANVAALTALLTVGGNLQVNFNFNLTMCCAIYELVNGLNGHSVSGTKTIGSNKTTCLNIPAINTACSGGGLAAPSTGGQFDTAEDVQRVEVFPNPASAKVNVLLSRPFREGLILFYDMHGRLVRKQSLEEGTQLYSFETAGLPLSIYMLHVLVDGEGFSQRLIIE